MPKYVRKNGIPSRIAEKRELLEAAQKRQKEVSKRLIDTARNVNNGGAEQAMKFALKKLRETQAQEQKEKTQLFKELKTKMKIDWEVAFKAISDVFAGKMLEEARRIRQSGKATHDKVNEIHEMSKSLLRKAIAEKEPILKDAYMRAYSLCLQEYSSIRLATKTRR